MSHIVPPSAPNLIDIFHDQPYRPLGIRYSRIVQGNLNGTAHNINRIAATALCVSIFSSWYILREATLSAAGLWSALLVALGLGIMIDIPRCVWARLAEASPDIDLLFTQTSRPSHSSFCGIVTDYLQTWRIIVASAGGASLIGILYVLLHRHELGFEVVPGVVFFSFAGFWTGHSAYLIAITASLCHRIGTAVGLNLNQLTPISTPGLVGASRAMRTMAGFGLLLLLVLSGALLSRYAASPSRESLFVTVLCIALGFSGVTLIGLQSQRWLAKPANEAKDRVIRVLEQSVVMSHAQAKSASDD